MNKVFELNTKGRDFVIGDLHGCFDLFNKALEQISFDKKVDRMFSVGDLIDRGDKSLECLRLVREPWFHAVRGNHEDMLIDAVINEGDPYLWHINGGLWNIEVDPDELLSLASKVFRLPFTITVETNNGKVGICHAQPPSLSWKDVENLDERDKQVILWSRSWIVDEDMQDIDGVNMTIHGHTPIEEPKQIGNVLFIDTGAVFNGNLTCMQL